LQQKVQGHSALQVPASRQTAADDLEARFIAGGVLGVQCAPVCIAPETHALQEKG
jgi:hypothetical protein